MQKLKFITQDIDYGHFFEQHDNSKAQCHMLSDVKVSNFFKFLAFVLKE